MINFLTLTLGISLLNTTTLTTNQNSLTTQVVFETSNPISYSSENWGYYLKIKPHQIRYEQKKEQERIIKEQQEKLLRIQQEAEARRLYNLQTLKQNRTTREDSKHYTYRMMDTSVNSQSIQDLIAYWTGVYGGDVNLHIKIARCESGLNPGSVGGGGLYLGVYQQHKNYWASRAATAGFAGQSPLNANANIAVSIWMMRTSGYHHWKNCI